MSVEPRGPTTEELRARVLAQSECVCAETSIRHCPIHGQGDPPPPPLDSEEAERQ